MLELFTAGLAGLALETIKTTAKEESGSTLAKWLNKDIGKAAEQALFSASKKYIENYEKRHGSLKVTCIRMDEPIKLDEIYTAVQLLDRSELGYFESIDALENLYRESGRRRFGFDSERKQQGIEVANQEHYLMVLGGPGVGKSTFLRKVGLEALKGKDGTFQHACIPVFLALQRFNSSDVTVNQLIVNEFATCGFPEPEAFTQAHLKRGRLLILFDGLDEVPPDYLDHAITQIKNFVDQNDTNRFIASCRVAAYKGGFTRFKDVAMVAFEDEQIEDFIRKWFRSAKDRDASTADQCWELLNRPEYKAAKELAQTPLLLTLLCAVYDKSLDFPKNRASLYGEALDVLLKEWAAEKRIQRDPIYQELSIELERELLAEIAYDSFVEDQLFFSKRDVTSRIKEFLVSNLNAPKHLDSEQVLEAIEVQQGIFVERARDTYSFSHLTFQEYLTAQFIVDNQRIDVDNQQIDWLVENYLTDGRWREVFLLVAGLMPGRKGSDELLLAMEKASRDYINAFNLHDLIQWADKATQCSEGKYRPAAKRAAAIAIALNSDQASDLACILDHNLEPNDILGHFGYIDYALSRATVSDYSLDIDYGAAYGFVNAFNEAIDGYFDLAHSIQNISIFSKSHELTKLFRDLEELRSMLPNINQSNEHIRQNFSNQIVKCWYDYLDINPKILNQFMNRDYQNPKFGEILMRSLDAAGSFSFSPSFDLEMVRLSPEELEVVHGELGVYMYVINLMVRCKEAAVRVSPQVWEGIEECMVTVP
ncbi:MAG: NACHT domain-containing protein [Elainellaceae cyanobacterium]